MNRGTASLARSETRGRGECARIHRVHARATVLACLSALALSVVGCGSPEDKARDHVERGRELLGEENVDVALIEFKNALRQDPKSVDANIELARIALREKNIHDASFYFREAYQLVPDDESVGIELALALISTDVVEARRVINEVIKRHTQSPLPHAVSSQIYQTVGELRRGLRAARRAVVLGPDMPGMHWQLGASCQAMVYRGRVLQQWVPDAIFEEGVRAYDDFVETGGEEWKARLEQARLIASWPDHEAEAISAARRAMKRVADQDEASRYLVARHLSRVAKAQGNRVAFAEALEEFIALNPRDLIAWKNLADLRSSNSGGAQGADAVYKKLLKRDPRDGDAHVLYTAFIAQNLGVRAGLKYLDEKIEAGIEPARLLAVKANLQRSVGLEHEAAMTRRRMKKDFPDDAWTIVETCRHGITQGHFVKVAVTLRNLAATEELTTVFVMLAQAEMSLGNLRAARDAARRAVDVAGRFDPKADRMLAITLVETGGYAEAIEVMQHLELRMGLLPSEELLLARAYYGIGDDLAGRQILVKMLQDPELRYSKEEIAIEYARREIRFPGQRDRIRAELNKALARNPKSLEVLAELVRLDLTMGQQAAALDRIADMKIGNMTPGLALMRARLRANAGDLDGARGDAKWVFRKDPSQPNLLELLVTVFVKLDVVAEENAAVENRIAELESQKESRPGYVKERLSWVYLLNSRLLLALGREDDALSVLGGAIIHGDAVKGTKLDFAYLTAKSGKQLDIALELATSAAEEGRPDAAAIDTVGYVLLKMGEYESAHRKFIEAVELAKPPRALFFYHIYIVLTQLERPNDALSAIRSVISIDPEYPNAVAIRDRLQANLESGKTKG